MDYWTSMEAIIAPKASHKQRPDDCCGFSNTPHEAEFNYIVKIRLRMLLQGPHALLAPLLGYAIQNPCQAVFGPCHSNCKVLGRLSK